MLIFHGRVNVWGSSMVASYERWSAPVAGDALDDVELIAVEVALRDRTSSDR
jgi:hypothetical protein